MRYLINWYVICLVDMIDGTMYNFAFWNFACHLCLGFNVTLTRLIGLTPMSIPPNMDQVWGLDWIRAWSVGHGGLKGEESERLQVREKQFKILLNPRSVVWVLISPFFCLNDGAFAKNTIPSSMMWFFLVVNAPMVISDSPIMVDLGWCAWLLAEVYCSFALFFFSLSFFLFKIWGMEGEGVMCWKPTWPTLYSRTLTTFPLSLFILWPDFVFPEMFDFSMQYFF